MPLEVTAEQPPAATKRIAAVVVTFNRLTILKECLQALNSQTRPPDEIIVVNNGSTDGTAEWLAQQTGVTVVTQDNSGSSGGQHTGIKTAHQRGHDWFWCMDDDTIPKPDALAALVAAPPFQDPTTGFLCSMTLDAEEKVDNVLPTVCSKEWWGTVITDGCVRVDHSSFVSVMSSRAAVEKVGLPLKWLFIWGEDTEFTKRISGHFKGWAVLKSVVVHKYVSQARTADPLDDPKTKTRYLYLLRNELVRLRIDPTIHGRFSRLGMKLSTLYMMMRWILQGKLPLRGVAWAIEGLFRPIRLDFPD
ncbi:MAG: glycosyltransferase family 2 protein [Pirellulales bacterium]